MSIEVTGKHSAGHIIRMNFHICKEGVVGYFGGRRFVEKCTG
jgi:hypothetical protein